MEDERKVQEKIQDQVLLRVIAASTETIKEKQLELKEDIKELKEVLKSKVDVTDFVELKKGVEELKQKSWFAAGFAAAVSFVASYVIK